MKKALLSLFLVLALIMSAAALAEDMLVITLSDEGIETAAEGVLTDGSVVTITKPGEYLISGSLSNGQLVVDCRFAGKVTLHLNGVTIHNEHSAAILIGECSPRAVISLVDQSENVLSNGAELVFTEDDEPNGVIFTRSDLTISGSGKLTVRAGAMDGIVSKDDLIVKDGTLTVSAPRHGLRGKDSVEIEGGDLTIECGKDGIRSNNDKDPERGFLLLSGGVIRIACGDDALSFVTKCTISGSQLEIRLMQ